MPPRSKRNATSRRHHPAPQPQPSHSDSNLPPDLLSFEPEAPPQTTYGSMTPAVFDMEPSPSDPELGRPSAVIWAGHNPANPLRLPTDYWRDVYGPGTSGSDIDDGGPISPSTSPRPLVFRQQLRRRGRSRSCTPALGKIAFLAEDTTSDESSLSRSVGSIRSPVLAR